MHGCKDGWWAFAGYCYKFMGFQLEDGHLNTDSFKDYLGTGFRKKKHEKD